MLPKDQISKILKKNENANNKPATTILALPDDVIKIIAGHLTTKDLINLGKSAKKFYKSIFNRDLVIKVLQQQPLSVALAKVLQNQNDALDGQLMEHITTWETNVKINIADKNPDNYFEIIKLAEQAIDSNEQKNCRIKCLNTFLDYTFSRDSSIDELKKIIAVFLSIPAIFLFIESMINFAEIGNGGTFSQAVLMLLASILFLTIVAIAFYPSFQARLIYDSGMEWKRKFDGKVSSLTKALGFYREQRQDADVETIYEALPVIDIENPPGIAQLTPNYDPDANEKTRLMVSINR